MWYICANPSEIRVIESKFERQGGDVLVRDDKKFLVLQRLTGMPDITFSKTEKSWLEEQLKSKSNVKMLRRLFDEQRGTIDFSNEEPFNYL